MSGTINPYSLVQKRIADRIQKLMTEQELSYGELSKMTGIPKSALFRYATGETVKVPLVRLEEIACALDVDLPELIGMIPIEKKESDVETTGERIRRCRKAAGMTQEELAERLGTTPQNIYKYEKGIVNNIPVCNIEDMAEIFGISPAELVGWATTTKTKGEEKMAKGLTDEQVEQEIAKLEGNEYVKLARLEERIRTKRRRRLYMLRYQEKRGRELAEQGLTLEQLRAAEAEEDCALTGEG